MGGMIFIRDKDCSCKKTMVYFTIDNDYDIYKMIKEEK